MRRVALALACAAWLILGATAAWAQTYRVLEGTLTESATGKSKALTGAFDASLSLFGDLSEPPVVLIVDDFDFAAGDQSFTPRGPIVFEGLTPALFITLADQIHVDGDAVSFLRLHAGGLHAVGDDEVSFRTFEFRATETDGGEAFGQLGDGPLPRRLHLEGTLFQVDQTFMLPGICVPTFPGPPPPGGGGIEIGGGGAIVITGFNDSDDTTVGYIGSFGSQTDQGGYAPISLSLLSNRPARDPSQLGGIQVDGNRNLFVFDPNPFANELLPYVSPTRITERLNPLLFEAEQSPPGVGDDTSNLVRSVIAKTLVLDSFLHGLPTLEELGITAPAGAEVSLDPFGALLITSEGDLFIAPTGVWDFPGVTSVTVTTSGSIIIDGTLAVPSDVSLYLNTGGGDDGGDPPGGGGEIVVPPIFQFPPCDSLLPLPAVEQEVGHFSIVASAAQPVEIDVEPKHRRNRVKPGSRKPFPVAILGSAELDVRDIDPASLRLGNGEAAPVRRGKGHGHGKDRGHGRAARKDVNHDHRADLVVYFRARDAEIAYGDTLVCLTGMTHDGTLIEGCDAIDTIPKRRHGRSRRKH